MNLSERFCINGRFAAGALAVAVAMAANLHAQIPETVVPFPDSPAVRTRVAQPQIPDSLLKPPISPSKAFFTSLLLPGYAQSKLNRPTASMLYAAFEVISIGMARKSAQDLKAARSSSRDSIIVGYSVGTGGVAIPTYGPGRFTRDRVKARRTHYEDWIAAIVFNHLISAADGYVAANLWDFGANVSVSDGRKTAIISARRSF